MYGRIAGEYEHDVVSAITQGGIADVERWSMERRTLQCGHGRHVDRPAGMLG
jgi:hypothetical protein